MIMQHNLSAMNIARRLSISTRKESASTKKLASGSRINQAADDAAGLTISEKMRSQIRGLIQASQNAQNGVLLIQTAEGALQEIHEMLRSEEHTSELQSRQYLVCRLLLEKK